MNLLLNRDQKSSEVFSLVPLRIGGGTVFHLNAELELDDEEVELVKTYHFADAPLVISDTMDDLKNAFRPALLLGAVTYLVTWFLTSSSLALGLALLVVFVMTVVYFKTMREQIVLRDLLNGGRTFRCDSIVSLIQKEAFLEGISEYVRQVLESAKNWSDRESISIQPLDKKAAKQMVLRMSGG